MPPVQQSGRNRGVIQRCEEVLFKTHMVVVLDQSRNSAFFQVFHVPITTPHHPPYRPSPHHSLSLCTRPVKPRVAQRPKRIRTHFRNAPALISQEQDLSENVDAPDLALSHRIWTALRGFPCRSTRRDWPQGRRADALDCASIAVAAIIHFRNFSHIHSSNATINHFRRYFRARGVMHCQRPRKTSRVTSQP
jgi:hypothetical protein